MGLKPKIFLRAMLLLTTVVVVICVSQSMVMLKNHRNNEKRIFMSEVDFLAACSEDLVYWNDLIAVKAMMAKLVQEHKQIEYAFIKRQGQPYVHTFPDGIPKRLLELPAPPASGPYFHEFENKRGEVYYDIAADIGHTGAELHLGLRTYPNTEHMPTSLRMDDTDWLIHALHGGEKDVEGTYFLCLASSGRVVGADGSIIAEV